MVPLINGSRGRILIQKATGAFPQERFEMHTKHTFLLISLVILMSATSLFGYVLGPDPGMNGIFGSPLGCAVSGCHTGNTVNAPGGSVTITGLPAAWTPGQVYPLTITVARTGQRLFG